MKAFEEKFTAWADGKLTGDELADFERELSRHPDAPADKAAAQKLRTLLRAHSAAPRLGNADFFNLQVMQRVEAELPKPKAGGGAKRAGWFTPLSRLVWAGAACLLIAFALFKAWIPVGQAPKSDYFAQVIETWPADDSISATTLYNPEDDVTVLWLDGLDYIPASHKLQ
jgi:anti-sigma factor RsiW